MTVTVWGVVAERDTVKTAFVVPELPSLTVTSPIDRAGKSSLVMVPRPWGSARVAPLPPLRVTVKVSSFSMAVSPVTLTARVLLVSPAAKVSVPEAAV